MKILMRKDTKVVEKSVEVKFADGIFKTNRHGSKLVRFFISYSENSGSLFDSDLEFHFAGMCHLLKDNAGIIWEFFSEDCTRLIAEMVVDIFDYQELVDYISGLPS